MKYGGTSDSTAARPKFTAQVFTWERWISTRTEGSATKSSAAVNRGKGLRKESSASGRPSFPDFASPPWLKCLQSGYRGGRSSAGRDEWTRKFETVRVLWGFGKTAREGVQSCPPETFWDIHMHLSAVLLPACLQRPSRSQLLSAFKGPAS